MPPYKTGDKLAYLLVFTETIVYIQTMLCHPIFFIWKTSDICLLYLTLLIVRLTVFSVVCDASAYAFVKNIKGHTCYFSCGKGTKEGHTQIIGFL